MKKMAASIAVLAIAGVASASILVPNGDFELGNADWSEVNGGGSATYTYPATGGNAGGYGQIDSTAGTWAIWVAANDTAIPLSNFGVSAGETITLTLDMKEFSNDGGNTAGLKVESWDDAGYLDNGAGDVKFALTSDWATYTFDYTVNAAATALKFVPVQHDGISVGYDNIGVVPEPATMGLLGLAGGVMFFLRRMKIS